LNYWLSSGLSLEDIAKSFFEQDETKLKYPDGFSNADFIQAIYQNAFKRKVDSDGFDYWNKELENNNISRSLFILAVINGAKGEDADLLANQLTATNQAGTSNSVDVNISIGDDTNDLYINSAVFDDNSTTDTSDDKLYIYFIKDIDDGTVSTDSFNVYGDGLINGSEVYNSSWFNYKINLSADSEIFASDSNISISDTIDATDGYELYYETKTKIEQINKFSRLTTGDTDNTTTNSDGDLKRGLAHKYTGNSDGTITDNNTALIWQKEDDDNTYTHSNAINYCKGLDLGSSTEWRLPTIDELVSITDKGRVNPAINPIFTNTDSSSYWSFSSCAYSSSYAWVVDFYSGGDGSRGKDDDYLVRCVRDGQ